MGLAGLLELKTLSQKYLFYMENYLNYEFLCKAVYNGAQIDTSRFCVQTGFCMISLPWSFAHCHCNFLITRKCPLCRQYLAPLEKGKDNNIVE